VAYNLLQADFITDISSRFENKPEKLNGKPSMCMLLPLSTSLQYTGWCKFIANTTALETM